MSEDRIRDMVRAAVEENPRVLNKDLLERAREIDAEAVEGLTLRQFHGRYRLPVSRALSDRGTSARQRRKAPARAKAPAPPKPVAARDQAKFDAVRDVFRRFAVQLARAESRSEIVRVVAGIDAYVDDVLGVMGGPDGGGDPPQRGRRRSRGGTEAPAEAVAPAGPEAVSEASPAATPERPPRDMRRRRRPKASLQTSPPPERDEAPEVPAPADPAAAEKAPSPAPQPPVVSTLSSDLEAFRRRKLDRLRAERRLP